MCARAFVLRCFAREMLHAAEPALKIRACSQFAKSHIPWCHWHSAIILLLVAFYRAGHRLGWVRATAWPAADGLAT